MKGLKKSQILFIPGIGETSKDYKTLSRFIPIAQINWNQPQIYFGGVDVLVGFSMGSILACTHALKRKTKTLILCSMTPGVETLARLKADRVYFLMGEKERWAIKDLKRLLRTLSPQIDKRLLIVPDEGHRLKGRYLKTLNEILSDYLPG